MEIIDVRFSIVSLDNNFITLNHSRSDGAGCCRVKTCHKVSTGGIALNVGSITSYFYECNVHMIDVFLFVFIGEN